MGNANINALYAGSLRIKKYHFSFLSNFTFYKWCVSKVAHCMNMFARFDENPAMTLQVIEKTKHNTGFPQIIESKIP